MSDSAYFLGPDGQVVAVDPAQAPLLQQARGYLPATPQQIEDYQASEKYGGAGQQAIAGLEGLGRGLTARLSTPLEMALGVSPEGIAGRMKAHPGTAALGEAAGIAAPLIATAGAAAPAEAGVQGALRTAAEAAAPSLIARAGQGVARLLPSAEGVLGRAAAGATEGALYGAGNVVHEAALGDPNLTAQNALAQVGLTAALGGGLGGVLGVAKSGLGAAIGKARTAIGDVAEGISTPEKLKALAQEQHDAIGAAIKLANREIRPEEVQQLITAQPGVARDEVLRMSGRLGEVSANMRAQPELFPQPMFPAKLESIRDALDRAAVSDDPAELFGSLNDAKQTIDKQLGRWGRIISPEQQDAIAAIRGVRTELKTALENEAIWGPAGVRQAAFNEAQSSYFDALKDFRKEFMLRKPGRGISSDYTMDAGKLSRLSDTANPRYPMRQEVWNTYQSASKTLIDEIANSHANAPVGDYDPEALTSLVNKSGAMEQSARQQGAVLRMLNRMGGLGSSGTIAGGIVGGAAGAGIGFATDLMIKSAKFIPRAVDALSHLNANNEAVTQAIEAATARLASGSIKAAKAGRGEVIAGLARVFGMDAEEASDNFEKHTTKLRELGNPATLQAALEEQAAGLHEHAPQTAQALHIASTRAVAFLTSKIPAVVQPAPLVDPLPPSQEAIAKFNRYREAVENPLGILRQAAAGTLTQEGIEAVQTVYPHLYRKMQEIAMDNLASSKDMPRSSLLMFSLLLGMDLDGTTSPQAMQQNMMTLAPKLAPPAGVRPAPARAAKITLSKRMQLNSKQAVGEER